MNNKQKLNLNERRSMGNPTVGGCLWFYFTDQLQCLVRDGGLVRPADFFYHLG